jgi:hypothetical protein
MARPSLTPELRLLLECASDPSAGIVVGPDLRWERVVHLAAWHRLSPVVYVRLRGSPAPPAVLETLEAAYYETAARNLRLLAALDEILAGLDAAGIPAIVLKGAALVETVYADPALRPMSDLDVLVHPHDLAASVEVVRTLGYAETGQPLPPNHRHHPALIGPDGRVPVELHRFLTEEHTPGHFDLSGFWDRAQPGVRGPRHLVPAPEDLLAHLCMHFLANRVYRSEGALGQVRDIAEVVRRGIDWRLVEDETSRHGLGVPVYAGLLAAQKLLGAPVPGGILERGRPSGFDEVVVRQLLDRRVLSAQAWLPIEFLRRRKHPVRRLFPPRDQLSRRHAGRPSAFYLRRVVRAAAMAARALGSPTEAWTDLKLNRTLRRLQRSGGRAGSPADRQSR